MQFILFSLFFRFVYCEYQIQNSVYRNTTAGPIVGLNVITAQSNRAEVFFGVPYAQPPTDLLRFDYPRKTSKWTEPKNCTQPKAWCYQFASFEEENQEKETEDCLYVNVFTPVKKDTTGLFPVLVWIHGGSFSSDSANVFPVEGTINNIVSENIVVVFINYRLGPQGFMSLGNELLPGNVGLEDQILALEWIRDNIGYFNGDSERITLTGESAGAACVSLLALSPRAEGLFHQTIIRSGSSLAPWAVNVENTVNNTRFMLERFNCLLDSRTEIFQCLQNVTFQELKDYTASLLLRPNAAFLPSFTPVIDFYRQEKMILPKDPKTLLKFAARLPMMAGITNVESLYHLHILCKNWLLTADISFETEAYIEIDIDDDAAPFPYSKNSTLNWNSLFPEVLFKNSELIYHAIEQKYFHNGIIPKNRTELFAVITQALSDYFFAAPLLKEAEYYAENAQTVYLYRFGYRNDFLTSLYHPCPEADEYTSGSVHGTDVAMLFQSTSVLRFEKEFSDLTLDDLKISRDLSTHTANFVIYGNPNGVAGITEDSALLWAVYEPEEGKVLFIDSDESIMKKADNCSEFWLETVPLLNNLEKNQ